MNLELLANELLLDLFEYLDGIYLLRAFHGLNSRLDRLLFIHFRAYRFDFRSISKYDFDRICQHYLPSLIDRIISLNISDDDETPTLPELLLSYGFTVDKFPRLQSLSLYSIQSFDQLNQLILHCRQLPYLTHLKLINGYIEDGRKDISYLINNIWNLPKLYHCYLDYSLSSERQLTQISTVSSSIQHLFMENIVCTLRDLSHLFNHTPSLQYLGATVRANLQDEPVPIITSSIISIKLTFENSASGMTHLFEMMPNLCSLNLKTMNIYLTGDHWEEIIINYLPKIKIFRLRMYFQFPSTKKNVDKQFKKLINTYRSSFWIEKHRWFVQCDCIPVGSHHHGVIYTLPYAFDTFLSYDIRRSEYTCPNDRNYWSYDRVHRFKDVKYENNLLDQSNLLPIRFPNIRHLKIPIPFDDNSFWSLFPSLHRLTTLEAMIRENYTYSQLQRLIDLSPQLYSLRFFYSIDLKMLLSHIKSPSIRRLHLITESSLSIAHFNHDECVAFADSQLGRQCEVLLIQVKHRTNVLDLIKTMDKLRTLIVQCKDDKWNNNRDLSSTPDELVEWLRSCLPSRYSITRDKNEISNIRIWIDDNGNNTLLSHLLF